MLDRGVYWQESGDTIRITIRGNDIIYSDVLSFFLNNFIAYYRFIFKNFFFSVYVCKIEQHLQEGRKAQQYLDQCWKQMDNVSEG